MTTTVDDLQMTIIGGDAIARRIRSLIEDRLYKWSCVHISYDAQLIATELITNVKNATPDREIRFRLSRDDGAVVLAVWDSSDQPPRPRRGSGGTSLEEDNGGWGLLIVDALATRFGHEPDPAGGKWIWARLDE